MARVLAETAEAGHRCSSAARRLVDLSTCRHVDPGLLTAPAWIDTRTPPWFSQGGGVAGGGLGGGAGGLLVGNGLVTIAPTLSGSCSRTAIRKSESLGRG